MSTNSAASRSHGHTLDLQARLRFDDVEQDPGSLVVVIADEDAASGGL